MSASFESWHSGCTDGSRGIDAVLVRSINRRLRNLIGYDLYPLGHAPDGEILTRRQEGAPPPSVFLCSGPVKAAGLSSSLLLLLFDLMVR